MTKRVGRRTSGLGEADRDALVRFSRAYLHEDLLAEYGSAAGAAEAFARDAEDAERAALVQALRAFVAQGPWTPPEMAALFRREFGARWSPASIDDVTALAAPVERAISRTPRASPRRTARPRRP